MFNLSSWFRPVNESGRGRGVSDGTFGAFSVRMLRRRCVFRADRVRCDTVGPRRSWDTMANCKLQGGFSGEECLEGVESVHRGLRKK